MKIFTRYRILNAARALVSEVGVERVTMRKIARLANVTAPAIYKHFVNKRALLDEVIESGFDDMVDGMIRGLRAPTGSDGLKIMTDAVVGFAELYPNLTKMMLVPQTNDDRPVGFLETQVKRCMRERVMRPGEPQFIAALLWAQMRGVLSRKQSRLRLGFDRAMEELQSLSSSRACDGVATSRPAA